MLVRGSKKRLCPFTALYGYVNPLPPPPPPPACPQLHLHTVYEASHYVSPTTHTHTRSRSHTRTSKEVAR